MSKIVVIGFLMMPFSLLFTNVFKDSPLTNTESNSTFQQESLPGEMVYKKYCISCHQVDGGGVPNMSPPLLQTSFILGEKETLIKIVLNGLKNVDIDDQTYNNPMPALGSVLKDQQIADVLTYVRNSFGNKASVVTAAEVKVVRSKNK